jgi:hypothetical protein
MSAMRHRGDAQLVLPKLPVRGAEFGGQERWKPVYEELLQLSRVHIAVDRKLDREP